MYTNKEHIFNCDKFKFEGCDIDWSERSISVMDSSINLGNELPKIIFDKLKKL